MLVIKTDGDTLNSAVSGNLDPLHVTTMYEGGAVALFPNPAASGMLIRIILKEGDMLNRVIFLDQLGRIVGQVQSNEGKSEFLTPPMPAGMYHLQIATRAGKRLNSSIVIAQ